MKQKPWYKNYGIKTIVNKNYGKDIVNGCFENFLLLPISLKLVSAIFLLFHKL